MAKSERKFLGVIYYVSNESEADSNWKGGRQSSPLLAWFVLISWLTSIGLNGVGLFSTPYMRRVVAGQAPESLAACVAVFLIAGALCGWPWLLAFVKAYDPMQRGRVVSFASAAILVAAYVRASISNAPMEGVGYSVALGVLLTWLAYPISRVFGPR
jgi:hypothetical protein